MPELPDIQIYLEALERRVINQTMRKIYLQNPFLLRTVEPPINKIEGKSVNNLRRIGKCIAFDFDHDYWLVLHLMIAGRLHWHTPDDKRPGKRCSAIFEFDNGVVSLTEAGTKKRASLHLLQGVNTLETINPGGVEPLEIDNTAFKQALTNNNHTLKRALTDPRIFSGIGNAYSDEILHSAGLSPIAMTQKLSDEEIKRLFESTRKTLNSWTIKLRDECGDHFPEKVTAFRDDMAVHGKFNKPCPVCETPIQRICYATNETNYCPRCQTNGKVLADRSLSRLLKKDWPRTVEELEYGKIT
ncbi:MAG: formamidopyrimidine-DNA glycosylase [Gammaproteobacteria bacterium]|nr:formamidopyrimidine-DNA glycosylase [Gammaproteobacteria bacterium]